ncbi:MAG: hypothetical protein ACR2PG_09835, partial [Hyphomicrobiaceae bacterium]
RDDAASHALHLIACILTSGLDPSQTSAFVGACLTMLPAVRCEGPHCAGLSTFSIDSMQLVRLEAEARRRVAAYLGMYSDEQLVESGMEPRDIELMRQ